MEGQSSENVKRKSAGVKRTKMKTTPFSCFMLKRRRELDKEGRQFGGLKELDDFLNDEWVALKVTERNWFRKLSIDLNEGIDPSEDNNNEVSSSTGDPETPATSTEDEPDAKKSKQSAPDPLEFYKHYIGDTTVTVDLKSLNPDAFKIVLRDYDEAHVLVIIKNRFMTLVGNEEDLKNTYFPVVHFNYYAKEDSAYTYVPAEAAFVNWSLNEGFRHFRAALIDTRDVTKNETDHRHISRSEKLYLPAPRYTYEKGCMYSCGTDNFKSVLDFVYDNCIRISDPLDEIGCKYVLTASDHLKEVRGCLAWLMEKTGVDLGLRVFPLELVLQEYFRCCATIRMLKEREKEDDVQEILINHDIRDVHFTKQEHDFICGSACIRNVRGMVIGPFYSGIRNYDTEIGLGCDWHQNELGAGGIAYCSAKFVRKWSCLALSEASYLLKIKADPETHAWKRLLTRKPMVPRPWTEKDAVALEIRQRLGVDEVDALRKFVLEDHFIFPNLLETLKKTYPDGFTFKPKAIIWPVDRDMEEDLNYSPLSKIKIEDPDRALTLKKRKEKARRGPFIGDKIVRSGEFLS